MMNKMRNQTLIFLKGWGVSVSALCCLWGELQCKSATIFPSKQTHQSFQLGAGLTSGPEKYHLFFFFSLIPSLSRFNVVPQKVLDTELKKTFAHFNEGRIPVSINWTLRMCAGFHSVISVVSDLIWSHLMSVALDLEASAWQQPAPHGQFSEQHLPREGRYPVCSWFFMYFVTI